MDISPPGQAKVQKDEYPLDVVHITAEMAPVAKVGGLGDVVQGLAKATAERGNNVQVRHTASHADVALHCTLYHCLMLLSCRYSCARLRCRI